MRLPSSVRTRSYPLHVALLCSIFASWALIGTAVQAQASLGTAQSFAVLGASTVTNTGPSVVTGNLGVSPGTAITGFPPGIVLGATHATTAVATQARNDAQTAHTTHSGSACNFDLTGQDLGGLTLVAGTYCFSTSAQLTGPLVLDAQGNANAEFIFQIGSTLTTASASSVAIINGGSACNVYWIIGTSATLGSATTFVGNIIANASITLGTAALVSGRALALTGAVTMDTNAVTLPPECDCIVVSTVTDLGGGCGVPAAPVLSITAPISGQAVTISVTSVFPNAMLFIYISPCGGPAISVLGTTCVVHVDLSTFVTLYSGMTDIQGNGSVSFVIPAAAMLVGQCFVVQALVWEPSGPLGGDHATNALQVIIGCM